MSGNRCGWGTSLWVEGGRLLWTMVKVLVRAKGLWEYCNPDWSYGDISGQNPLTREYPPAGSKVKQGCPHSGSTTHHLHIWPNLGEAYSLTWMKDVTMWMSWRLYSGEDRMLEKHKRGYHPMVSLCQARSSSREGQPPMHFPICELASMSLNQITPVGWRGSRWEESGRIKVIARS